MSSSFLVRASTILAAAGLMLQPAFSQGRGGGGTTSGGNPGAGAPSIPGGGTGAPNPTTTRPTTIPTQPTPQQSPGMQQPIFLSGQVMMEDGTPPQQTVTIERVCNGYTHAEGYTDSKGYFSIQLFQRNNGVLQDASEDPGYRSSTGMGGMGAPSGGGMGQMGGSRMGSGMGSNMTQEQLLMGCELRAKLAGYRSQSVILANRHPLDPPDIGVILLHRLTPSEDGATVSAVSLAAPKEAKKAFKKGQEALKKHKPEDARKEFEKAVAAYPHYADAWYELGRLQLRANDMDSAHKSFDSSVQADPKFVPPYIELSLLELRAQNWQALADITGKAVKLDTFDYPQAFYFNAVANYYLKNLDQAEKSAREAERLDTRHMYAKNLQLLGVILAQRQNYSAAAEEFRNYLKFAPGASDTETVKAQLSQVEKLAGQGKQ